MSNVLTDGVEADMPAESSAEEHAELMQIATTLVIQLEANNINDANQTIYQLCKMRETNLFQEIGKLTRNLHETLNSFSQDKKFETLMNESLPDAKKRLDYVVQLTEESAHKTLTIVEQCMPLTNNLSEQSSSLYKKIQSGNEVGGLEKEAENIEAFLLHTAKDAKRLGNYLTDVLVAQSYQDLTGQVVQRIIKLVQDVENNLVSMIKKCGLNSEENVSLNGKVTEKSNRGYGPAVPGVTQMEQQCDNKAVADDTIQSQDDVDDLLSTLGF